MNGAADIAPSLHGSPHVRIMRISASTDAKAIELPREAVRSLVTRPL
jgi:hypothetical protein